MLNNKTLLNVEKIFFHLFLFSLIIPLSRPLFHSGWTRIYFFDLFLFPLLLIWVVRLYSHRTFSFHKYNKLDISLMALLFWLLLSDLFGLAPAKSIEAWLLVLRCFLIYLYISRNIGDSLTYKSLMYSLCILIVIEGGLGIIQYFAGSNIGQINRYFGTEGKIFPLGARRSLRVPGTFINTNILAGWMTYLLLMAVSWGIIVKNHLKQTALVLISIIAFFCLLITFSRVKIVSAIIGLFLLCWWHKKKILNNIYTRKKTVITLGLIIVIFAGGIVGHSIIADKLVRRFTSIVTFESTSFEKKSLQRKIAFQTMLEHPFTGIGQRNFNLLINKNNYPYLTKKKDKTACHNIPLKIGAESGVIGLILFCMIFLHFLLSFYKRIKIPPNTIDDAIQGGALICCVVVLFDMQFNTVFSHPSFMPLFFLIISLAVPLKSSIIIVKHSTLLNGGRVS